MSLGELLGPGGRLVARLGGLVAGDREAARYDFVEVSEASGLAERDELRIAELRGETCILMASPELEETERSFYSDTLNFDCAFRFVRSREEGRMLVAGNHGFMPTESRHAGGPEGFVIQRIPLVGPDGAQLSHDYYAFWPKQRTTPLVMEFATILEGLFAH